MKLESFMSVKKWTSLSVALNEVKPSEFISPSLYRIAENLYFSLTPFRLDNSDDSSIGPYILALLCAADDGAAKRAAMLAIEEDAGNALVCPEALVPANTACEYEAILAGLKSAHPKVCQESASYRIASDGKFVHRTIETERFTYYFRSAEDSLTEPPYAILYKL